MPHITIEHSKCINEKIIDKLLQEIPNLMEKIEGGNFKVVGCKTRAIGFNKYYVAGKNQDTTSFCHITIKILEGRGGEIKVQLAQKTGEFAKELLEKRENMKEKNDLSVDIVDLDKNTYQKISY